MPTEIPRQNEDFLKEYLKITVNVSTYKLEESNQKELSIKKIYIYNWQFQIYTEVERIV